MYTVEQRGTVGRAGAVPVGFAITKNGIVSPTPDEIVEAKTDGICPRCGAELDICNEGGLCTNQKCGFSF